MDPERGPAGRLPRPGPRRPLAATARRGRDGRHRGALHARLEHGDDGDDGADRRRPAGAGDGREVVETDGGSERASIAGDLETPDAVSNLRASLLLGTAYGACLGSVGTLIGTPPNAIVFGAGEVTRRQMLRAGVLLDVVVIVVATGSIALRAVRLAVGRRVSRQGWTRRSG